MIIEEIQAAFPKLRKSEQKVASYMLEHVEEMEKISLGKMAKESGVSEATVMRMLKAVGYKSFKEMKIAFVEERMKNREHEAENRGILGISMQKGEKVEDVPGRIIQNTISLLQDSLQSISAKKLKKAVRAIEKAERVCIFSVENSNAVVDMIYAGLLVDDYEKYHHRLSCSGQMIEGRKYEK